MITGTRLASVFFAASMALGPVALAEIEPVCSSQPKGNPVLDAMDCTADPCVNFFQYACGAWIKSNPLPSDRSRFGRSDQLAENNNLLLKESLEKASVNDPTRSLNEQKIGDLYASCMDETTLNKLGVSPLKGFFERIDAAKSKADLGALVTWLHAQSQTGFFNFFSQQDKKDSSNVIATFVQGGMGLPSKSYYFDSDAKSQALREKYVKHIERTLVLSGISAKKSAAFAKAVMAIETLLAEKSLTPVERRDPKRTYNIKTLEELQTLVPFISWKDYVAQVGAPAVASLNVAMPEFAQGLQTTVDKSRLDDLKAYLRWHLLKNNSEWLSQQLVDEDFDFYGKTLSGQQVLRPRWRRCTGLVDGLLGEALGQAYVAKAFSPESKTRMLLLIANLEKALAKDIDNLPWMTKATKKQAEIKLKAITQKIGYPDKWRDYSSLKIVRGDLIGSITSAGKFEGERDLAKIGKPVDKGEWGMTPPTVNAYYSQPNNSINFPAGILQPPFFSATSDDALNYGGIGVVIGHEITHGFDDRGRQFDALGNLIDWWTPSDAKAFNERAACLVDEYGNYVVSKDPKNGDVKQDGKLTLGENAADNGGLRIAWNALMDYANGKNLSSVDGLTPQQRFFLGFGQIWCGSQTEENAIQRAKTDPHSAFRARVNLAVQNMPEFQKAFSCKTGQPMAPEKRCRIW